MKLNERVTIRLSTDELNWFKAYADETDTRLATTLREVLGYFIQALENERSVDAV
jgi:uncharacterized protein (DUF4415 family)